MEKGITLVAVFYNEEKRLPGYFRNIGGYFDRMIFVDCSSTDNTYLFCEKSGAAVIKSPVRYFEQNVNKALDKVETGWVMVLDADERIPQPLKKEITEAVAKGDSDVFLIRRVNYLFGGFSTKSSINTFLPRLFRKGCVRWEKEMPHEAPKIYGRTKKLSGEFYHYAYPDLPSYLSKMADYLCIMPSEYAKKGKTKVLIGNRDRRVSMIFGTHGFRRLFIYPPVLVLSHLFAKRLILDGMGGVVFSFCAGIYAFFEEAMHWEADLQSKGGGVGFDWSREFPDR